MVYEGLQLPFDQALRVESRWFAKILRSPEAAAMIRSLFVSMQEINKGARRPAAVPAKKFKTIGVLGSGFMGAGIAYVSALAGLDVVLVDRDPETAQKGKDHSQKLMDEQVSRGRATAADRDAVLARIKPTADFVELKNCDLVIEAVFEDRKVKEEVIARAQNVIGENAIFGSNTSTLPITSLAESFKDRSRFIGIHFFSPVERMNLVEIILGKETGEVALAGALDYVRAIRKTPIVVNDSRGFYTSRVVGTYLREGHLMLADGVPAAMIENVGRMAGMPVGPLALNDEVAVDLAWKILQATEADLGPAAIDPRQKTLLEEMVAKRGRYGRKNGKGFYDYPQNGPKRLWRGLSDLQPTKLDPDTIDVGNSKHGCWRCRRWKPPAASRRASSPTCAKPMSARSSASASRRSPAALSPISTAWAPRPSSPCAASLPSFMATASSPASSCSTWRKRARRSTAASRRRRAELPHEPRQSRIALCRAPCVRSRPFFAGILHGA